MEPFDCKCEGNSYRFYYDIIRDPNLSRILVRVCTNEECNGEIFTITLDIWEGNGYMIQGIENNGEMLYSRKCIPETIIPIISRAIGQSICSSSQLHPKLPNERRALSATAYWERMVRNGTALKNDVEDRYYTNG